MANEFDPVPHGRRSSSSSADRVLEVLPLLGLALLLLLALAWHDILPGGWRLRSCFEPDGLRQARRDSAELSSRLAEFSLENPAVAPGSIIFLGSSAIERFPFDQTFPGKPCVGRGIANLSARSLLAVLPECLPRARPAGIVLYTGAVDWRARGRDPSLIVERIGAVLEATSRELPGVPSVLLGILPERRMQPAAVEALRRTNDRLRALARERSIVFVDTARPPIADPTGALAEDCSTDDLHLNPEGYRHLAGWIVADGGEVGRLLAP